MFTKTITYEDFNGTERTETHHFNLTQTEFMEIYANMPEGLSKAVDAMDPIDPNNTDNENLEATAVKVIETLGNDGVLNFYKELVLKAYGIKSEDGRRFIKSKQLSEEFSQTLAYDNMMMEFMTTEKASSDFINAIIPAKLANKPAIAVNGSVAPPAH